MSSRAAVVALLVVVMGASASGCSPGYNGWDESPELVEVESSQPGPGRWAGSHAAGRQSAPFTAPAWRCSYSPTNDWNWHNDVLCSNGVHEQRPHLLRYDPHITSDEMVVAAAAYERSLNASSGVGPEPEQQRPRKRDRFSELNRILRQLQQGESRQKQSRFDALNRVLEQGAPGCYAPEGCE